MAAKKKKKAKKAAKPVKAKKAPAKKSKKTAKKTPAKKAKKPAKKNGASARAGATKGKVKAAAKKAPAKKKQIVGEGDYAATRKFDSDQASFVKKNKANIPAMAKDAEKALEGPEGDSLRDAEATAAARSRDNF